MIYYPNTILKRYTYTTNKVGLYGETVKEYVYNNDVLVDFQNESNQELAHQYGVDLQNLYKIYFDSNVIINDTDQLRDDEGNKYHIIGNIRKYVHFHNYQKAVLVRERR